MSDESTELAAHFLEEGFARLRAEGAAAERERLQAHVLEHLRGHPSPESVTVMVNVLKEEDKAILAERERIRLELLRAADVDAARAEETACSTVRTFLHGSETGLRDFARRLEPK